MSKRFTASATQLKPDPRFSSVLASKFVNCLMHDGKKSVAQRVFYDALDVIGERLSGEEPIEVFTQAVENVKPMIEVRSKRVGGATYQVPTPVNPKRRQTLALRWILAAIREKKGRPFWLMSPKSKIRASSRKKSRFSGKKSAKRERFT